MKIKTKLFEPVIMAYLLLFSFFHVFIYMLQKWIINSKADYIILLFNTIVLAVALYPLVIYFKSKFAIFNSIKTFELSTISDKKYAFIVFVIQVIAWFPVFLAYYPGFFNYDVSAQVSQTWGNFNSHHPLTHTLYLKFFYDIVGGKIFKNYTTGIAFATITQLLLLSGMMVYVHLFFKRMNLNRFARAILVIMSSLLPVFSMLGISMTKDVLFAGNMAVLFTSLGYWYRLPTFFSRKSIRISFVLSIIGTILLRNNGIYPLIALTIALLIQSLLKKSNRELTRYIIIGLASGLVILLALQNCLKASKGHINEMLSLPYQQVVYTYYEKQNLMSETDNELVECMFPGLEYYSLYISDPIKDSAQIDTYGPQFVKLYIKLLFKHPDSYLKAFCHLNAGYLSILDNSSGRVYGTENRAGVFLSNNTDGYGIEPKSYFPALEKLYEDLFTENKYEDILGLNFLCKSGIYFWAMIAFVFIAIEKKQYELLPMIVYIIVFVFTLLAGPCSLIRYAFPVIVCVPVLGACVLHH